MSKVLASKASQLGKRPPSTLGRRLLSITAMTALSLLVTVSLPFVVESQRFNTTLTKHRWFAWVAIFGVGVLLPTCVIGSVLTSIAVPFGKIIGWHKRVFLVI